MAASAALPPVSWTAWPRSASPGFGYGIRYQHGLFKQGLDDGWQVERPEDWLAFGNPWEFERPDAVYPVRFYGHVVEERDAAGSRVQRWEGGQRVLAVAYDTPVVGWGGKRINTYASGRPSPAT